MGLLNNANNSDNAVVNEVKLYTGIAVAKVVAVNPTLAELNNLGVKTENEPQYDLGQDDKGNKKLAVDFWLKFDEIERLQKQRFFITVAHRLSADGAKKQMIDKTGKTCWIGINETSTTLEWIDNESLRPAYIGEEKITNFLINWLNIKPGDEAKLENIADPATEIKAALKALPDNKIRCMLTVKHADGGKNYQNIYDDYFDRATSTSYTYWEKHINKKLQDDRMVSDTWTYDFQEYKPVTPTNDTNIDSPEQSDDKPLF